MNYKIIIVLILGLLFLLCCEEELPTGGSTQKKTDTNQDSSTNGTDTTDSGPLLINSFPSLIIPLPPALDLESTINQDTNTDTDTDADTPQRAIEKTRTLIGEYKEQARIISVLICQLKKLEVRNNTPSKLTIPFELADSNELTFITKTTKNKGSFLKMCRKKDVSLTILFKITTNSGDKSGTAVFHYGLDTTSDNKQQISWFFDDEKRQVQIFSKATDVSSGIESNLRGIVDLTYYADGKFIGIIRNQISNYYLFKTKILISNDSIGQMFYSLNIESTDPDNPDDEINTNDTLSLDPQNGTTSSLAVDADTSELEDIVIPAANDLINVDLTNTCSDMEETKKSYTITQAEFDSCTEGIIKEEDE